MALPLKLTLEIVTPERSLIRDEVDDVEVPGSEGYLGILPGHTPLLATLGIGELSYRKGQEKHSFAIAGGFVEVLPDRVTILAQVAERASEIDVGRAAASKKRAEDRLSKPAAELDAERARRALRRAETRLQVAGKAKSRV